LEAEILAKLAIAVIPVTPFQQNCSMLWDEESKKGVLIDPGGEPDRILAAVAEQGVTIERILVTHGHLDHAGAVADIAARVGVPIEGPQQADSFWIDRIGREGENYGMGPLRSFTPDRWLNDGDQVRIGPFDVDVIHCPGHTPGHVVFYHAPSRFAVVGDVLFRGSIGRTDLPHGSHETLIHSIRDKLFPLGDDVTFLPGHGDLSTFGHERKTNPFVSDLAVGA
jgi:glyoxylase-like metal-dependent hydrolase (beta-lactamase superfamily II)